MTHDITKRRAGFMTPLERKRSLKSLELYVTGLPWTKMKALGGYNWPDFSRMMTKYPDLGKAYQEARRISAHSFEDKALELADKLAGEHNYTGTGVRAVEVAMNQYRWSAARRNPTEYAEAGANKVSLVVPIQINSSLNLAEPGAKETVRETDAYQFAAEVIAAEPLPAPPEAESVPEVETAPEQPETAPVPTGEALAAHLGLPDELPAAVPQRVSPGRPKKRHKDNNKTSITRASRLKSAKKNPTVARALGLTEDGTNGGSGTRGK